MRTLTSKLDAVIALIAFKKFYKLSELSEILDLHPAVLSRYISGDMTPSYPASEKIIKILTSDGLVRSYINRVLSHNGWSFNSLFNNTFSIALLGLYFRRKLLKSIAGSKLDFILSAPDFFSSTLTFSIVQHLDVCVTTPNTLKDSNCLSRVSLRKGSSIAVITAQMDREMALKLIELGTTCNFKVIIIETVILKDPDVVRASLSQTEIIQLIP